MFDMLNEIFNSFANSLSSVLPRSPFSQFLEQFENLPFLGYLNWFIPVGACIDILLSWLSAIALFYLYSIALRWLKAIS